ncbi:MAG: carbon storage regulator [Chromatiales bacterium]
MGEEIRICLEQQIEQDIQITILGLHGSQIRIGVDAPK